MNTALRPEAARRRQCSGGIAVVVMLALLSIILIYIAANARTLSVLKRELKLIEQKQVQRLEQRKTPATAASEGVTNLPSAPAP